MVLDHDCVRDVLLAVEALDFNKHHTIRTLHESLPKYSEDQLRYTCVILADGGFLDVMPIEMPGWTMPGVKVVHSLTYKGHELLARIRDEKRWHGIKKALPAIRDYSLDAINAIAEGMTSAALSTFIFSLT